MSLPFTDWCPALGNEPGAEAGIFGEALEYGRARGWRFFETRGGSAGTPSSTPSVAFYGHDIDLTGGEERMFTALDSSVRRGVRKASSSPLRVETTTSPEAMREYYHLHCRTRRRHGAPPQPFRFFDAITRHVLAANHGEIFAARIHGRMAAGAIFFRHGASVIYKFGASDVESQEHRPNNLILWEAMRQFARADAGCCTLDAPL
ncbi:MAG: GNAT family N-acetyltransferase [Rhodobacteraceae bacterium]|nr:GNAT family N-acetyltransferase [Paracoccaceae bacterium]